MFKLHGRCKRVWVLMPPTDCNVSLFEDEDVTFEKDYEMFEHVMVLEQDATEALLLPPFCIYGVYNVRGGWVMAQRRQAREWERSWGQSVHWPNPVFSMEDVGNNSDYDDGADDWGTETEDEAED